MKKMMALDVGTKTIGIAKGFLETGMVFPICTLKRQSVKKDSLRIKEICEKEHISTLIVGLPLQADGSEGRMARLARQIANAVHEHTQIPVFYQDESDSTMEAQERLYNSGRHTVTHKAVIDQEAAMIILERWMRESDTGSFNL
ncbi:MAG: Holliday junction resolvase RuvX [Myxococcota bacterium]|nr:Holliday junction resolvase RuvX [Myxococcota bacterium]